MLFDFDEFSHIAVNQVNGDYSPQQAIEKLLAGTAVTYEFANPRTLSLTVHAIT